ncbi:MAG: hydrogenase maturation protease [Actinomycetota bacterium]
MRILVAGVGNLLRGDDGFGVEVAHRLQAMDLPADVTVAETGIGGVHLVQEILAGYDALIVIDAVDRGKAPGTVMVIEPEIESTDDLSFMQRMDYLADMHYTKPSKALMLAKALEVLPERTLLVGCQPEDAERYGEGLSKTVAGAVDVAVDEVRTILEAMLAESSSGDVR